MKLLELDSHVWNNFYFEQRKILSLALFWRKNSIVKLLLGFDLFYSLISFICLSWRKDFIPFTLWPDAWHQTNFLWIGWKKLSWLQYTHVHWLFAISSGPWNNKQLDIIIESKNVCFLQKFIFLTHLNCTRQNFRHNRLSQYIIFFHHWISLSSNC